MSQLDQRGYGILNYLLDKPAATGKELEDAFSLSRRQVAYSIGKINDYLAELGYEKIRREKTGSIYLSVAVKGGLGNQSRSFDSEEYIYAGDERIVIIALRILVTDEPLSTYHFVDELQISKNTLMNDLKGVEKRVSPYRLTLHYDRQKGYDFAGTEIDRRECMLALIRHCRENPVYHRFLAALADLTKEPLDQIQRDIEDVEERLWIEFTDERLAELALIFAFILHRIRRGHPLKEVPLSYQAVKETREYEVIAAFAGKYGITSGEERLYLTIQILISAVHRFGDNQPELLSDLEENVTAVIEKFEQLCCIAIGDKKGLTDILIQHLIPAVYRIRYNYRVKEDILDLVLPEHKNLHEMVKLSMAPVEKMVGKAIPDTELAYLTMLFGGWLQQEGIIDQFRGRKRAIVVCTNGVTVANYLLSMLTDLFPEIDFLEAMSQRAFAKEEGGDYDLVFTSLRLATTKQQIITTPLFDDFKKQVFRARVLQEVYGYQVDVIDIQAIMKIVGEHATIQEPAQLERRLRAYLQPQKNQTEEGTKPAAGRVELWELLNEETIQLAAQGGGDWVETLYQAGEPLLAQGSIERRYLDAIVRQIREDQPYIMLAEGVIVAHAGIADGVNRLAMSLLTLPKKMDFGGYMAADIIVVLATPDKTVHLNALYQLLSFLETEENLTALRQAKDEGEISVLLKARIENEGSNN